MVPPPLGGISKPSVQGGEKKTFALPLNNNKKSIIRNLCENQQRVNYLFIRNTQTPNSKGVSGETQESSGLSPARSFRTRHKHHQPAEGCAAVTQSLSHQRNQRQGYHCCSRGESPGLHPDSSCAVVTHTPSSQRTASHLFLDAFGVRLWLLFVPGIPES